MPAMPHPSVTALMRTLPRVAWIIPSTLWFGVQFAFGSPPAHRVVFHEYALGKAESKKFPPTSDFPRQFPEYLQTEMREKLHPSIQSDIDSIEKSASDIRFRSEGLINNSGPYYSLWVRGKRISGRVLWVSGLQTIGKHFLFGVSIKESGAPESVKIIRDYGITDWNPRAHGDTDPVLMPDGWVELDTIGLVRSAMDSIQFAVTRNGKAEYRFKVCDPVRDPIQGFAGLDGKWILQIGDRLIVDGEDMNKRTGFPVIFSGRPLAGGLFYLAKVKDRGPYRAFRNGIPVGKTYEYVPHDFCCGSFMMNPRGTRSSVGFYGIRRGTWYLAIIDS